MTLFLISDLHLCDCGPRDNFFGDKNRLLRFNKFLDYVQSRNGVLYILGDLFDWWQTTVGASVMAYLPILNRISQMQHHYVIGNHDSTFKDLIYQWAMPDIPVIEDSELPFEEVIGGRKFAFLHGHEADPTCRSDNPDIGELTAIISGMLEDRNKGPVKKNGSVVEDKFIHSLELPLNIWRAVTHQRYRRIELIDGVEAYRLKVGADVVVSGHTHERGRIGTQHYNTGCWCRDCDTFVTIDDAGNVEIFEWTDNGPILNDSLLI